jgi:hypothetical protein
MSLDSAASILKVNGFGCQKFVAADSTLACDKLSDARLDIVRRRWQALLTIRSDVVVRVQSSTGLIGP